MLNGKSKSQEELVPLASDRRAIGKLLNLPPEFLDELEGDDWAPGWDLVFRAFEVFPPENTRVVILGQDPYHTPGKASGLAFGYHPEYTGPVDSSLRSILEEAQRDTGLLKYPFDTSLVPWAMQGVLLLNTRLSVRLGKPMSHAGMGWERIVQNYLMELDRNVINKVYMLWGKEAQSYKKYLDIENNLILETSHPCKFSAHRGFIGCGHFSKANEYLKEMGREEIEW